MSNTKPLDKASKQIDNAFKSNKIDHLTHYVQKERLETKINAIVDDGETSTSGLLQIMRLSMNADKKTESFILSTQCDHFASGFIDASYGCGYRNTQMLISSIKYDDKLKTKLFNKSKITFFLLIRPFLLFNF
jgi:hypothetical protein